MKVYAGAPSAARNYVECDRGRPDDYYLAQGTGIARRFTATDGRVAELAPLNGEDYEAWVAGRDPATGEPRGVLRSDAHAVRFVEVIVNGPKTWSIAAALHPDIAAAYEAAQDRAAGQILGWLSAHATTRVGPRGGQVPVPLEVLEAATVRHYTSRAGDPHWHLHLQINARVLAAGKWRGLWTVDVRDSLAAINGIGHAAMATDPQFAAALAAHGYTRDGTGEIRQLVGYVGQFSARHAQIARNADRYEREWMTAHPGELPGPALRRAWDARAWAAGRPDKVTPAPGTGIQARWQAALADLGFHLPRRPVQAAVTPVGALNRDQLVARALTRLAAARSAWNAADVRGEVERLIAAAGVVVDAAVRVELAEDLTARALDRCVPLLQPDGVPEHIRALTSRRVLAVEADLTVRLSARTTQPVPSPAGTDRAPRTVDPIPLASAGRLDAEQAAAASALAGDRALLVLEGAAGAGKTTMLAAARRALEAQGHRLMVVTPTLKAAKVAAAEVGTAAGSAARLAYEHGWRWNADGVWTRLQVGALDPVTGRRYAGPGETAELRAGDLLVVDEAGMLDQDTARALLTVADERRVRVALVGDRHQLAAVGRGGVLDLAVAQIDGEIQADGYLSLAGLHRFIRLAEAGRTVPDVDYAELTLAMRAGTDPGAVFDALLARGQIRLHPDPDALRETLAEVAAADLGDGERIAVVADTREQVAELNAAIRDRLVAARRVDDVHVMVTATGQWIGVGDLVVTRRNDRALDVANRDTWIVTEVGRGGTLAVTRPGRPAGESRVLFADYVTRHVELGYATTVHGAQGDTVTAAHLVIGDSTGAAAAYVGMTRGRSSNTAHFIAENVDEAREQWCAVFARDRADLGPGHAAALAAGEAAAYAPAPAPAPARSFEAVLAELRAAWVDEQRLTDRLEAQQLRRYAIESAAAGHAEVAHRLKVAHAEEQQAGREAAAARERVAACEALIAADTDRLHSTLLGRWQTNRDAARHAAQVILEGPGRFGRHRGAVDRARAQLRDWFGEWAPHVPALRVDIFRLPELAAGPDTGLNVEAGLQEAARRAAEQAHPERHRLAGAAGRAQREHDLACFELRVIRNNYEHRSGSSTPVDYAAQLAEVDRALELTGRRLADARARITTLTTDPAIRAQPPGRLAGQLQSWRAEAASERARRREVTPRPAAEGHDVRLPGPGYGTSPGPGYGFSPGHSHRGPSIGI